MKIVETDDNQINITISTGVKGDTGKSLTFTDLTPDEIAQLKGPKGDNGEGFDPKKLQDTFAKYGCYTEGANAYEMLANVFLGLTNSNPFLSDSEIHSMEVDRFCSTAVENQAPVAHLSLPGWFYYSINDEEPIQAVSKSADKIDYNYVYKTIQLDQNATTFSLKIYKPNKELINTFTVSIPEVQPTVTTMPAPDYASYGMIEKVYPEVTSGNVSRVVSIDYNNTISTKNIVFMDITDKADSVAMPPILIDPSPASHKYPIENIVVYSTKKFKATDLAFVVVGIPKDIVQFANRELLPSSVGLQQE